MMTERRDDINVENSNEGMNLCLYKHSIASTRYTASIASTRYTAL